MIKEPRIPLFDLVMCLSDVMDLISPATVNHHKQVAYIAFNIAKELGLPKKSREDLMLAGILHDVGMFSLKEKLEVLNFQLEELYEHAELGCSLLKVFEPFSDVATLVRFHHVPWNRGGGVRFKGEEVPAGSHILHLADRTAVLVDKQQETLG